MRYLFLSAMTVLALTFACGGDDDNGASDTATPSSSLTSTSRASASVSASPALDACPHTPGDDVVGHAEDTPDNAVVGSSFIDCVLASNGDDIYRASLLTTDEGRAAILFKIEERSLWCNELAESALQVLPNDTYLIEWFAKSGSGQTGSGTQGTTWCGRASDGEGQTYGVAGKHFIEISTHDPVFGVAIHGEQTIVKLLDGQLTVTIDGATTSLTAHKQISIAAGGKYEIQDIELTADDEAAIAQIRDATPLPDLTVKYSDSSYSTNPPSCRVYFWLSTVGETAVPEVITRFEFDGQVGEDKAENLDPGKGQLRSITVPTDCPNFQQLSSTLVVDPDDVVAEKDEDNNTYVTGNPPTNTLFPQQHAPFSVSSTPTPNYIQ